MNRLYRDNGIESLFSVRTFFLDEQMDHITVITLALSSCDHHDSHKISVAQVSRCNLGNLIFSISLAALQKRLPCGHSANAWSKDSEVDLHTRQALLSLTCRQVRVE
jgi:hypothetical protein